MTATYPHLPIPEQECIEGLTDRLCLDAGINLGREEHFIANLPHWTQSFDKTRSYAQSILQAADIYDVDLNQPTKMIERASTTSMFGSIAANTTQLAINSILSSTMADMSKLAKFVETDSYRQSLFPILEIDEAQTAKTAEASDIEVMRVTAGGEPIKLQEMVKLIIFTRQLLLNNGLGVIAATAATMAEVIYRQLTRRFVELIEANGNLSDGAALFVAGAGNILTSGSLDVASLNASADALRSVQTTDGGASNVAPRYVLVPSSLEMSARVLVGTVNESVPPESRLEVITMPWLSDSYFYMLGDQARAPAFCLSTLSGGSDFIRAEVAPPTNYRSSSSDGTAIRVRAPTGIAAVSRLVVRNTTA